MNDRLESDRLESLSYITQGIMFAIFYIGKRTLFDILSTGVFWVAVGLAVGLCFVILYLGWQAAQAGEI